MAVVWKYTLSRHGLLTTPQMPFGAKVLTVAAQDGEMRLWAEVDPARAQQERQFMAVPTGFDAYLDGTIYLGTVFLDDLVLHIYERTQ